MKNAETTKAIKITLSLTTKGYRWYESIWDMKKTAKMYILTKDGEIERRLPKEDLHQVRNSLVNLSHSQITYTCVTTSERVEAAKEALLAKVNTVARAYEKDIQELVSHIK